MLTINYKQIFNNISDQMNENNINEDIQDNYDDESSKVSQYVDSSQKKVK